MRAPSARFAEEAGRFVAVSAGDSLETVMAAHGSGAVVASAGGDTILNVDVGGGTTKIAVCRGGEILAMTAVEVGARLLVTDDCGRLQRIQDFGRRAAEARGETVSLGGQLTSEEKSALALDMAGRIGAAIAGRLDPSWLRLDGLPEGCVTTGVIFSGGVSEYVYGTAATGYGDLGPQLARALRDVFAELGVPVLPHRDGIRATVIGASQYTVQVSGSTVYIDPLETLPVRNVATIRPELPSGWHGDRRRKGG